MTAPRHDNRFPNRIRIDGHGLVLREWTDDDLPTMVELFDEPEVDRWTPLRTPFNLEAARSYLDRARQLRAAGQAPLRCGIGNASGSCRRGGQ
ncbi:GNAT family N-acetyltransferase, partial [Plantactinospora solaniradicis]